MKKRQNFIFVLIAILQFSLCVYALKTVLLLNQFEKQIANEMLPFQNTILYSFDVDVALKGRNLEFDYKNLWVKKYDSFQQNGLVLFHPTKFSKQWKDKNPIINWEALQTKNHLIKLKNLPDGWVLYRIQ